ncbi:MAG: hypothetical protein WCT04_15305 [Planctomycetota bacterium]
MSRSSILNFESLEGVTLRVPATLLAVLGVVLALELVFRLVPEKKLVPNMSRQGEVFFMEREVLSKFDAPKIVFLGSSRIRRALVPAKLDEQLGLKKGSTVNLGLAMARVYESLYLYERNEAKLRSAEIVVLNLDEWHVSTGPAMSNTLYETHGPISERLHFPERIRTKMLFDGLLTMRVKMKLVPGAIFGRKDDVQNLKLDENNQILPPPRAEKLETYGGQIKMFYDRFDVSPVLLGHIEQLAKKVQANGRTFVLLQLPNRTAYQVEVDRTHKQDFENEVAAVRALATKLNVPFLFYRSPVEIGLTDANYEDYGHMKPDGAAITTRFLGDRLLELRAKK